jgi:inorganic pyrophosphatase
VISERPIERREVILRARVIGGIKLLDRGEADDKIIGVLEGDYVWDHVKDISQLAPCWSSASSTTSAPTRWCRANLTRW